jgi:hypothetical protein
MDDGSQGPRHQPHLGIRAQEHQASASPGRVQECQQSDGQQDQATNGGFTRNVRRAARRHLAGAADEHHLPLRSVASRSACNAGDANAWCNCGMLVLSFQNGHDRFRHRPS